MTRLGLRVVHLVAIVVVLSVVVSIGTVGGAPINEPGVVPVTALGGVVGALVLALLIVAGVRRVDR